MKSEVKNKINVIGGIYEFICKYQFCKQKIKTNKEFNYFYIIKGYLLDTLDIVFKTGEEKYSSPSERFANNISFLQTIFVHQDFIKELLLICEIEEDNITEDNNYSINRKIRNELVGHPVSKIKKEIKSLTLFGFSCPEGEKGSISYLRYRKDNKYEYEGMYPKITEIIERHNTFLNTYLDKVFEKLKSILTDFAGKIRNIEQLIYKKERFETIIKVVSVDFESIFKSGYIYDKESLFKIYNRRKEHKRYQNLIDLFYKDLKTEIEQAKSYIKELFEPKKEYEATEFGEDNIIKVFVISTDEDLKRADKTMKSKGIEEVDYTSGLNKLLTKQDIKYFELHRNLLKVQYKNDKLVTDELNNMDSNFYFYDDIEYYCSYYLIHSHLKG